MGCRLLFAELKVLLAIVVKYFLENVSIADSDELLNVGRFPTLTMECTLLFTLASMILSRNACSDDGVPMTGEILCNWVLVLVLVFVTGE